MTSVSAAYLRIEDNGTANVKVWENGANTLTLQYPVPAELVNASELERWARKQLSDAGFLADAFRPQFPDESDPHLDLRAEVRYVPQAAQQLQTLTKAPALAAIPSQAAHKGLRQ